MCDFSLQHSKSRAAKVADKLVVKDFGRGTRGFSDVSEKDWHCAKATAVCVLPGTEIAFDEPATTNYRAGGAPALGQTARFRQINKDTALAHHDALEFACGDIVLLTSLVVGQAATVLQLPAAPKTEAEAEEQRRLEVVG